MGGSCELLPVFFQFGFGGYARELVRIGFSLMVILVDQGPHPVQNVLPNGGCEPGRMLYILTPHFEQFHLLLGDLGVHGVDRLGVVVQAGCLQDNQGRTHYARYREYPQEQAIQDECYVFPVFFYLQGQRQRKYELSQYSENCSLTIFSFESF